MLLVLAEPSRKVANEFAHAKGSHTRRVRVPCPTVYLSHRSSLLTYLICFPFASEAIRRQPPFQDKANAQHDRERSFLKASCSRRVRVVLSSLAFRADANGKLIGNTIAACLRAGEVSCKPAGPVQSFGDKYRPSRGFRPRDSLAPSDIDADRHRWIVVVVGG